MNISKDQKRIMDFLIAEITITAVKFYIVQSVPGLHLYNSVANMLISFILIVIMCPAFVEVFKKKPIFVTGISASCLIVIFIQMLIFPANTNTIVSYLPKMLGMSLGCFVVAFGLREYELFYIRLLRAAKIIILFAMVQFVAYEFLGVVGTEELHYNMSFGFYLVVPLVSIFNKILTKDKESKVLEVVFFVIGVSMVVIMGSRGSILAVLIGCVVSYGIKLNLRKFKDMAILLISVLIIVIFLFDYENLILWIYNYLKGMGLDSRVLLMILAGSITSTTGREVLQQNVMEMIMQSPIFGSGLLCDLTSHNVFLEMTLFFGIPIGIVISTFIVVQWLKPLFEKNREKKVLMIIFLSYAVVDSVLNLTVLGKDMFWIYLGLALSTKILKKSS